MNLIWGVKGFYYEGLEGTDRTIEDVIDIIKSKGLVQTGDVVINSASMPFYEKSKTNTIKISVIK
jgi:pyruvate kinase